MGQEFRNFYCMCFDWHHLVTFSWYLGWSGEFKTDLLKCLVSWLTQLGPSPCSLRASLYGLSIRVVGLLIWGGTISLWKMKLRMLTALWWGVLPEAMCPCSYSPGATKGHTAFQVKAMDHSLLTLGNLNSLYFNIAEANSPGDWQRTLRHFSSQIENTSWAYLCAEVLHSSLQAETDQVRNLPRTAFPDTFLLPSS